MTELTQLQQVLDATGVGKWKAYSAYRDSGVEWLGEIPEHWEAKKIKKLCHGKYEGRRLDQSKIQFILMKKGNMPGFVFLTLRRVPDIC